MSSKRVGLADRNNNVRSTRLNALFTPSDKAAKETELEFENPVKKEDGVKKAKNNKKDNVFRQTYYMSPEIVEAVRIIDFESREGISSIVNRILRENIPEETLEQARKNLQKRG